MLQCGRINGIGPGSRPKVYIHRMGPWYHLYMNAASEADLASFADVVSDGTRDTPMSADELVGRLRGCSAILSLGGGGSHEITTDVLKAAGTGEVVCIAHWCEQMLEAATGAGITVTEGSNANTVAVAEWTLTAALMGIRSFMFFDRALKSGSPWGEPRREIGMLCESTVGIVGLGRAGADCAGYFKALGAEVIAYDPYWTQDQADSLGVTRAARPITKNGKHRFPPPARHQRDVRNAGAREFAQIEGWRGSSSIQHAPPCTDENALITELQKNRFTAFLDVFAGNLCPRGIHSVPWKT